MTNSKSLNGEVRRVAIWVMTLLPAATAASGQEAVERVKALLSGFGVPGRVRLQSYGTSPRPPLPSSNGALLQQNGPSTGLVVTDAKGNAYTAYFFDRDRSLILHRGPEHGMLGGMKFQSLLGTESERLVRRWIKAVGTKEPTRLAVLTQDETGVGHAFFPILRNGYPFVSRPRHGYDFAFRVRTGEFIAFQSYEQTPPTDSAPPKLNKPAALAAFKTYWDTQVTPEAVNVRHWKRVWYTMTGEPELGYYLPAGKTTATLFWRLSFMSMRDVGSAIQGGDSALLLDAATGEPLKLSVMP